MQKGNPLLTENMKEKHVFTVKHTAKMVSYSVVNFVAKNLDSITPELS